MLPQDLVKFGLIPELVGRVPVTVSLETLDRDALIRILTEPKSAIVKQYQKLLELDGVDLVTEGVITVNKVVEYAKDYLNKMLVIETKKEDD